MDVPAITAERAAIPASFFGLDLAPLERQPQRVDAQLLGAIKVLFGVAPPVAGQAHAIARLDASLLLPKGPLIVEVSAFNQVCVRTSTPSEIGREDVDGLGAGSVIHF